MRAAVYCRVSTLDQHPETQLMDLRQLADQRGFEVVKVYTDHGISGTRVRRPGLDEMLSDARRGRFHVLLIWSCDRIARSTRHCWKSSTNSHACRSSSFHSVKRSTPAGPWAVLSR